MLRLALSLVAIGALATAALAVPLSVRIDDQDFTFDTAAASYNYNGSAADHLTVAAGGNEVGSYRYLGASTDFAGNGVGFFPVWSSSAPLTFGGDLVLDLSFDANDGPYTNPGGDKLLSLTGKDGHLTITGIVGTPLPGAAAVPTTLLDITFYATSLVTHTGGIGVVDLVEASGTINTIFGKQQQSQLGGVVFLKFFATDPFSTVFANPAYDPLADTAAAARNGRVSGETGWSLTFVPEPLSLSVLMLGLPAVLRRRR